MTKAEEMVLKTVHDLGVAGASDVQNYTGLSATKATKALNSLTRKGYLKIASRRYQCDVNVRDEDDVGITFVGNLCEFAPKGRKAAQKIPDIYEPLCIPIPISNLKKWRNEMRLIDADKMAANEFEAFISAQAKITDVINRDINSIVHEKIQRLIADTPTVEDDDDDVVEQCSECGNEVWLKWDVERDGYTIYCPYCGYRMKLCSMCDVRDGGKCDWNSETGKCKNDKI